MFTAWKSGVLNSPYFVFFPYLEYTRMIYSVNFRIQSKIGEFTEPKNPYSDIFHNAVICRFNLSLQKNLILVDFVTGCFWTAGPALGNTQNFLFFLKICLSLPFWFYNRCVAVIASLFLYKLDIQQTKLIKKKHA